MGKVDKILNSWLSKKLSSSNNHVDQLANLLDEKSVWQRYGL